MGEIAGFLQDLQNSFEQDNTPSGQSSSPSNPGMPGSGATGSGSSVQWPFGSNGWPEWLPSFIQQNLQATNSESPPVGSSGGGTSSPSNSSASPGHSPGSSSTGNNSHGGTSGSVNLGGATEQPVSDPTGESTSEEGSSIVSNGSGRDADSQKIPIPPLELLRAAPMKQSLPLSLQPQHQR
jgi:hypothetical protein